MSPSAAALPAFFSRESSSPLASEADRRFHHPTNLTDLLLRAAKHHPRSGVCLVSGEHDGEALLLTYRALLNEARRILGGLRSHNRPPGAKIALLLERPRDFIPAFWACVLGGYIPCPLVPIRNDAERWAKHLSHVDSLLDRPLLISNSALRKDLPPGTVAVDLDTLRMARPEEPAGAADLQDPAVLMLTSGSTGNSKAVVLTHGNLIASMEGKQTRQPLTATDVALNWIAFDHVAALLEVHLIALHVGAVQVHVEPASILTDPMLFLRLIDRYRVSLTFAPNFLFGQINAVLQAAHQDSAVHSPFELDLSCVRFIISGGEANVVETGRRFLDLLAPYGLAPDVLRPAFGMTETCAGSVYSHDFPHGDAGDEFSAVGVPVAGLQMRIVDEQCAPMLPGEAGELQLRGPMIFSRYYNNGDATRAAFTADGWFRTGDLGRIENGRLTLVGRSKDSIIVSGVNYFSHELEAVLDPLEGIERSFVAAFPIRPSGADTEQLVVAFAASFSLADEVRLHQLTIGIRNTIVLLWGFRPALILPLPTDAFPKTSLGKIQRAVLRKRLEAGDFAAHQAHIAAVTSRQQGGYAAPEGQAEIAIAKMFAQLFALDPAKLSATASFFDLGGTSLDIIKLKRSLEDYLGIADVPIVRILQNPTVRGLANQEKGEYDPVVPLQVSGSKTPLFCIHPGTGEVLVYVSLANYFVNERPFYALRARGFNEGETPFATFDEMVETYVGAIRKRQPHGPYALAGYSFGGPVAFEIAKVLERDGERVAFVGSIDGTPFIGAPRDKLDAIDSAVIVAFFLALVGRQQMDELPQQLRKMSPVPDVCAYLIQHAPPERLVELDLDVEKFTAWAALAYSLVVMGQSYVPSGTLPSVTVFYAHPISGTKPDWLNIHLRRWDEFTSKANRYVEVAGEHSTLIGPKHVASFQAVMRAELDRALDGK